MSCSGERHCITCSDEGVPMRVVDIHAPGLALCATEEGVKSEVMTDLLGLVEPGSMLLVHAGTALQLIESPRGRSALDRAAR